MSLQVWLPFNRDIYNYGLCDIFTLSINSASLTANGGGKLGNCLFLSSDGQAVSLNSYMNVCSTYTRYSMSAWIYMSSTATNHSSSILSSGDWNSGSGQLCFGLYNYSSDGYYKLLVPNKSSWSDGISLSSPIKLNTWYNICITYDGINTRGYVNGEYVGSYAGGGITSSSNSKNLYVGSATYYSGFTLKGSINDVRIYDHCLSAKEIKEISKGLSLHYKLSDPYIESTTNLYSGWSSNCYNGATSKYNYGTTTDIYYDVLDDVIRVRMGTNNLDAWPFVFFNEITPPSNGEYRTLSFDYYPTIKDKINFYSYNTSGTITWISNGVKGTEGNIPVKISSWNHISVTIKNTGSSNYGFGYMKIGLEKHTSNTSNYWLFKNIQIESKDHSTGYTSTSTSRSESLCFDSSGFGNNGVVRNQSSISIERDSPRYEVSTVFNGTPFIIGQNLNGAKSTDALSLCAWVNPSQVSGGYNIVSSYEGGGAGLHISSGNIYFQIYSGGYINVSGGSVLTNTWYHVVGTYDNSKLRIYINGELKGEVAKTGNITYHSGTPWSIGVNPSGTGDGGEHFYGKLSDVRIYSTALSASDIKELYNTSASVDKNGNIYAYEFKEE